MEQVFVLVIWLLCMIKLRIEEPTTAKGLQVEWARRWFYVGFGLHLHLVTLKRYGSKHASSCVGTGWDDRD